MQFVFELLLEALFDEQVEKRVSSRPVKWVIHGLRVIMIAFFVFLAGLLWLVGLNEGNGLFIVLAVVMTVFPISLVMKWLRNDR